MVDLSNRIQQIINQYIESGQYFTINRARQYGKTTLLYLLEKELRKQDYLVLSLSFEAADEYFESLGSLAEGLSLDIEECLREQNVDEKVLEEWNHSISERFPMRSLGTKISNLCRKCGKNVVLMIDEVDKSSDNQIFLSFLGLLREKYLKCQQGKDVTFVTSFPYCTDSSFKSCQFSPKTTGHRPGRKEPVCPGQRVHRW